MRFLTWSLRICLLSISLFCALRAVEKAPWPLADEVLHPSSRVTWGTLENGLRYAVMPHPHPAGRVSLRLLVKVGSLSESDLELGYAHFVEHMAFKSTRNFPAGEMLRQLQGLGASFGPEFTANTYEEKTVYKMDLPTTAPDTLDRGFGILREFADGLLFIPQELEPERGVILSEARFRNSPAQQEAVSFLELLWDGTLVPKRLPIGTEACIQKADSEKLRAFYDAWYRPERMVLAVVGDIEPAAAVALVKSHFASLQARGTPRPEPDLGQRVSRTAAKARVFQRSGQGISLSYMCVRPREIVKPEERTWGRRLKRMEREVANEMLAKRLYRLGQSQNRIISDSQVNEKLQYGSYMLESVGVSGSINSWEQVLAVAEQEVRRVLEHGFQQTELDFVKESLRQSTPARMESFKTAPASSIIGDLVDCMQDEQLVFIVPDEVQGKFLDMVEQLTVEGCLKEFRELWASEPPLVFLTIPSTHKVKPEQVCRALEKSQQVAVAAPESFKVVEFAYKDFGSPAKVTRQDHLENLDIYSVTLSNQVRLNLKKTPYEKQGIRMKLRLGTGRLQEPAEHPGLGLWAGSWIVGGLGKHNAEDLSRLAPKGAWGFSASADADAIVITANSTPENFLFLLQNLTALFVDPAFRDDAFGKMGARLNGYLNPMLSSPDGPIMMQFYPFLAGGDMRQALPSQKDLFSCKPADLKNWLMPMLKSGCLEVSVVGDIDIEQIIDSVARTLGTLPVREAKPALTEERKLSFPKAPKTVSYTYPVNSDRSSSVLFCWPVRDEISIAAGLQLPMLATVFQERLWERLREHDGSAYAPAIFFWNMSAIYPGHSYLRCQLDAKPSQAKKVGNIVLELAAELSRGGATPAEFARAKAQAVESLRSAVKKNTYWLDTVLAGSQEFPRQIEAASQAMTLIENTTKEDLDRLAQRYLTEDSFYRCNISPVKSKR